MPTLINHKKYIFTFKIVFQYYTISELIEKCIDINMGGHEQVPVEIKFNMWGHTYNY